MRSTNLILKFILDYFLAFFFLILFFLPFVIISLVIFLIDGSPIFFTQKRAGIYGRGIKVFKFKTIVGSKLNKKISKLGKFLRITRLDEIPQILNVLRGELSFVGPRPLYIKYIKLYNSNQKKRLNMKPGITGWAQINGDNNISWRRKFNLDLWYVKNFNIFIDIKIIIFTISFLIKSILFYNKVKNKKIIIDKEFNGKN
jgi:lipopolysaccharide/colanic/teichoic acid biosynthesis glycosyltransferase